MDQPLSSNGWKTKEAYVMSALERHDESFEKVFNKLDGISLDLAVIKSRGIMYTVIVGALPSIAALAIVLIQLWIK